MERKDGGDGRMELYDPAPLILCTHKLKYRRSKSSLQSATLRVHKLRVPSLVYIQDLTCALDSGTTEVVRV